MEEVAIARSLMDIMPSRGLNRRALSDASKMACGDTNRWRSLFPGGETAIIWLISKVSDSSMQAAFTGAKAHDIATVITERFQQNMELKPFVRKVMVYDLCHPAQALARMQRTARAMVACMADTSGRHGWLYLTRLNLVYTALVFIWLYDTSEGQQRTLRAIRKSMSVFRL